MLDAICESLWDEVCSFMVFMFFLLCMFIQNCVVLQF